jgi:flagellar biosynthesis/type III secretory pathway chaperone
MEHDAAALIDPIESLIDEERAALLAGDLERLARLLDRKESLLSAIAAVEFHDMAAIERIKSKLARNQTLLESAMAGIRSVHDRLRLLRETRDALRTYDSSGQERRIESRPGRHVERRA